MWTDTGSGLYVTEASDMGWRAGQRPVAVTCPAPGCPLVVALDLERRSNDGELVAWVGTCTCGAEAHVLND